MERPRVVITPREPGGRRPPIAIAPERPDIGFPEFPRPRIPRWGQREKNKRLEEIENSAYQPEVKACLRRVEGPTSADGTTKALYILPPTGWEDHFGPKIVPLEMLTKRMRAVR